MRRIHAVDVVKAYKVTGLIPIRQAWQSDDERGSCAIDVMAFYLDNARGTDWALDNLESNYVRGFIDAWDADDPIAVKDQVDTDEVYLSGYWDAILCRDAVEEEFSSITEVGAN